MKNRVTKHTCVSMLLAGGLCLALAAPAAEPEYTFRMTTFTTEGSEMWERIIEPIAERIKLATDGRVEIKAYPIGVLAGVFEGHKAVVDGRADLAHHYAAFEVNEHPANAFVGAIPGGMGPYAAFNWLVQGGGIELWQEFKHDVQGTHPLLCGMSGTEVFMHSHRRVQTLADLKGLRYRTAGAAADVLKALGAAPTVVPLPEIFTLLERQAIDAAEYGSPTQNFDLGFHKVAKYIVVPGIHAPSAVYGLIMKAETWNSLPADIQRKFEVVCESVTATSLTKSESRDVSIMKQWKTGKNEIVVIDDELAGAVREEGRRWARQKAADLKKQGDEWMERMADSYYEFQDTWAHNSGYRVIDAAR